MSVKQGQGTGSGGGDSVSITGPVGGGTEAAAVRVTVANDSTGLLSVDDNGGSLTVDNAGLTELAAAINVSSQMDVNIAASGVTVPVSNAGLTALNGAISGTEVQVDVVASLPAGINNIGDVDVASIAAGDNNIGNVDIVSGTITTVSTVTNLAQQGGVAISLNTGIRDAGTQRITIATDDSVPVTNAGLTALNGAISGTEVQVDVVGALPAGTNAIGKLAANSGVDIGDVTLTANSGVDIGDVDVTSVNGFASHDAAIAGNPLIVGGVSSAAAPTSVSADQEAVRAWYLRNGAQATVVTAAGALIGGDAANGLDVDVTRVTGTVAVSVASAQIASGAIASGAVASGAFASGSIGSGAIASGAIAVGAIAAGATSIATTEDSASATGDHLVKIAHERLDTPVANANVSNDGDYLQALCDNFGKAWVTGTVPEDTAHVAGEAITVLGARRIDPCATSSGTDADWSTVNQSAEGALYTTGVPTTASGLSVANFTSGDTYTALTATAQVIKASAGNLYGYYIYNPNATATYVLIYNVAAASVTVGTTTALLVFAIPATSGANMTFPYPITFSNAGWSIAAATTGGGNTAPSTALEAMIFYK